MSPTDTSPTSAAEVSVLRDLLRVYDQRFLALGDLQRGRLMDGTRRVLGDGLTGEARAALPAAYRLRAFCILHDLRDELERLIRDETDGHLEGAVVVGGRVYAVYPYLRRVPRQDADITAEVGVDHRLDGLSWVGGRLWVRGRAALQRVEARCPVVELILRERATRLEHRVLAIPFPVDSGQPTSGPEFEVLLDPGGLAVGHWDAHVAVTALGIQREARFGGERAPEVPPDPVEHTRATAYFTEEGRLAIHVREGHDTAPRRRRKIGRLFSRSG